MQNNLPRCGECAACKNVEKAKSQMLKVANPPFSHANDNTVMLWNDTLSLNPCETWPKQDFPSVEWKHLTEADYEIIEKAISMLPLTSDRVEAKRLFSYAQVKVEKGEVIWFTLKPERKHHYVNLHAEVRFWLLPNCPNTAGHHLGSTCKICGLKD